MASHCMSSSASTSAMRRIPPNFQHARAPQNGTYHHLPPSILEPEPQPRARAAVAAESFCGVPVSASPSPSASSCPTFELEATVLCVAKTEKMLSDT
eukprot:scaffold3808_cov222-Pinguiococcus_pyrenoidosus.AAC.7